MIVMIRGGGDLASGIAIRLQRCGIRVIIAELPEPLVVRRMVSFAEAVHLGENKVENVVGHLISDLSEVDKVWDRGRIPVLVDPELESLSNLKPNVVVDARMRKKPPETGLDLAPLVIGLGPGFTAGVNCHAVIETNRGHNMGCVYWEGSPEEDTGIPGSVQGYEAERVLRAAGQGPLETMVEIGDLVQKGQVLARSGGREVKAPFDGAVRGLLRNGTFLKQGMKIGDVDPRSDPAFAWIVSDKSRCLGGAVLEAILSREELRSKL
jgi:xanthine dehydrogenase accessory factor